MFAINKMGQVFTVSFKSAFVGQEVKTLKKSKVHAARKGWPTEILPLADGRHCDDPCRQTASYLLTDDKFQHPLATISEGGVVCAPFNSEREYRALELA